MLLCCFAVCCHVLGVFSVYCYCLLLVSGLCLLCTVGVRLGCCCVSNATVFAGCVIFMFTCMVMFAFVCVMCPVRCLGMFRCMVRALFLVLILCAFGVVCVYVVVFVCLFDIVVVIVCLSLLLYMHV